MFKKFIVLEIYVVGDVGDFDFESDDGFMKCKELVVFVF